MPAHYTLLIVDDEPEVVQLLQTMLEPEGHRIVTAANGVETLAAVAAAQPDLVLMDVHIPRPNGIEVCRAMKTSASTRLIPIVLLSGWSERAQRIAALDVGADDFLAKPVDGAELRARVRSLLRVRQYIGELDSAESVILSLARTIEARDPCMQGHCERLAKYASDLGTALGLDDPDIAALRRGGYLHDLGKVAVPDAILFKPGPLTATERSVIEQHVIIGERLCGELRSLAKVRPIVRHHHERWNGTGYPDRLREYDIPTLARILGVVDAFDALTSERPYRQPITPDEALLELAAETARGLWEPGLVEALRATLPNVLRDSPVVRVVPRRSRAVH